MHIVDIEEPYVDPLHWPSLPIDHGPPIHHPTYYFNDGNIVLLVDNHLFKIHRYFLERESELFRSMFSLPQTEGGEEGLTDEKPIELGAAMQVTIGEIESFCNFMYYGMYNNRNPTTAEWLALLSIADKLDCADMRNHAITKLDTKQSTMEPFQRVTLAIKFHVDAWLVPAYQALCTRQMPLSLGEGSELGIELTVAFSEARERIRIEHMSRTNYSYWVCYHLTGANMQYCSACRTHTQQPPQTFSSEIVQRVVKEVFKL